LPPTRPEFFDRGKSDAEDERIEPCPGGVVDQGLVGAERDTAVAKILPSQEPAQREAAEHDGAWNDHSGAAGANHQQQNEREEKIELIFDGERPGVGEGGAAAQPEILDRKKKFPERKHFRVLAPRWQQKIDGEDDEIGRQDAQGAPGEEAPELDPLPARDRREQLSADQVAAENEEKVDADPAETVGDAGQRKAHDARVIDDNDDDRESAEKIETRLSLAISKARVDGSFVRRSVDAWTVANGS
jgi:hypothetical protein